MSIATANPSSRYRLLAKWASGGMADVYVARHVGAAGFEKACVIKRVLPHLARQTEFREMFLDEVRIPVANLVGDENDGWRVTNVTLRFELHPPVHDPRRRHGRLRDGKLLTQDVRIKAKRLDLAQVFFTMMAPLIFWLMGTVWVSAA